MVDVGVVLEETGVESLRRVLHRHNAQVYAFPLNFDSLSKDKSGTDVEQTETEPSLKANQKVIVQELIRGRLGIE